MSSRHFSTRELLAYIAVFALLAAVWCMEEPVRVLAIPVTGAMISGPIDLAIGGRTWFIPFAIAGSILFFILLLIWIIRPYWRVLGAMAIV